MDNKNENYGKLYNEMADYAERFHEKNKKRIRIGIVMLFVLPVALGLIRWLTDSDKIVFLLIWVISMFILSAYLISVEYMDDSIQRKLTELTDREAEFDDLLSERGLLSESDSAAAAAAVAAAEAAREVRDKVRDKIASTSSSAEKIGKIADNDFKQLTSSVVSIVIIMGLCVIPCLFAWFNTFSNWNPFSSEATAGISVAVANADEGAEALGLSINIGDKVIEALKTNDDIGWTFVDDEEAAIESVYAGECYAAVIIPEDFSSSIISIAEGDLKHPELIFYENEKTNAIAPKITSKVKGVLKEKVDAAFVDTLGKYVTEIASATKALGLDPQNTFNDINSALGKLDADLESSANVINAAAQISNATEDLLAASQEFVSSSQDSVSDTNDYLGTISGDLSDDPDGTALARTLTDMTSTMSSNLTQTEKELKSAKGDMTKTGAYVQDDLKTRKEIVDQMKVTADKASESLEAMGLTAEAEKLAVVSKDLAAISADLTKLQNADQTNQTLVFNYMDDVIDDIETANADVREAQRDINKADEKLSDATKDACESIDNTRGYLSSAYGDLTLVGQALGKSSEALTSLEGGLDGTAKTINSLRQGISNFSALLDKFSDSELRGDIDRLMENDASVIAENMATPIKMETSKLYNIENFGSQMAPFYTTLSQWIAALLAAAMVHVEVRRKKELGHVRTYARFLARYRVFLSIGIIQALLVSLGQLWYVGIDCLYPGRFVLAALVNGVAFTLIVYSLVFAMESIGLGVCVIVMVLQVGGSGGTFPVEVLPPIFQAMNPYMPFRYGINAMRECIGGMYGNVYYENLGILLLIALGVAIVGLLLHNPMHGLIEKVNESERESDIML